MYNESAKKATMKYQKEKRDKLTLDFPKGYKDRYKAHAMRRGVSLNRLIMDLLENDIEDYAENHDLDSFLKQNK